MVITLVVLIVLFVAVGIPNIVGVVLCTGSGLPWLGVLPRVPNQQQGPLDHRMTLAMRQEQCLSD